MPHIIVSCEPDLNGRLRSVNQVKLTFQFEPPDLKSMPEISYNIKLRVVITQANPDPFSLTWFWFCKLTCDSFNFNQVHNSQIKMKRFTLTNIIFWIGWNGVF
jgi:hypothetical protein